MAFRFRIAVALFVTLLLISLMLFSKWKADPMKDLLSQKISVGRPDQRKGVLPKKISVGSQDQRKGLLQRKFSLESSPDDIKAVLHKKISVSSQDQMKILPTKIPSGSGDQMQGVLPKKISVGRQDEKKGVLRKKISVGSQDTATRGKPSKTSVGSPDKKKGVLREKISVGSQDQMKSVQPKKISAGSQGQMKGVFLKKISAGSSGITCGEICSYNGKAKPGKYYPYLTKRVNCPNILSRMANPQSHVVYPPPKIIPSATYEEFTQNGECPNTTQYMIDFKPKYKTIQETVSQKKINDLVDRDRNGENINTYNDFHLCHNTLHLYKRYISERRGLVIGTLRPWLEAMLLNLFASHVTTSEYYPLYLDHPKLRLYHPTEVAKRFKSGQLEPFDFAASFSSIEHSGLGRYGDPLDPFGDLEAVAQVWCMLKPEGVFFLGLPMNKRNNTCSIVWNAHRLYGFSRLQHVTANWEVLDIRRNRGEHAIFVLRKVDDKNVELNMKTLRTI